MPARIVLRSSNTFNNALSLGVAACTSCRECVSACVCVQPLWPNYANLFNQMQLFPCVYRASFCGCGCVCSRQRLLRLCVAAAAAAAMLEKSNGNFTIFPSARAHTCACLVPCLPAWTSVAFAQSAPFFFSIFLDFPRSRK